MAKAKTKEQLMIDREKLAQANANAVSCADKFVDHFFDLDGEVFYSEIIKLRDAIFQARHTSRVCAMPRVGPKWDWDKGVTGEYYYKDEAA